MKNLLTIAIISGMAVVASAQSKPTTPAKPEPTKAVDPATQLSTPERLAVEDLAQKEQYITTAYRQLMKDEQDLVASINKSHPGYHFDPKTGGLAKGNPEPVKTDTTEK